jgi:hypothetical protein
MKLKQIIDGKVYNTETAQKVCDVVCYHSPGDFEYHDTCVYRTKKGAWFVAGYGNARSQWAHPVPNGSTSGSGIRVLEEFAARKICGQNMSVEEYGKFFPIEEA